MLGEITNKLGEYPILQFGLVVLMAIGSYILWWRKVLPKEDAMAIDTPSQRMVNLLEGIYRTLMEIRNENKEFARQQNDRDDEITEQLRRINGPRRR